MQILKPEIRQRIIDAALVEFSDNGFQDASLRRIAASAGITVGNIYAYFKNKQNLFEEVLLPFVDEINQMVDKLVSDNLRTKEYLSYVAGSLAESFKKYQRYYVILLSTVENKKYSAGREQLIALIDKQLASEHVIDEPRLRDIISRSLFEGLILIIKESGDLSESELKGLLLDYLSYTFNIS